MTDHFAAASAADTSKALFGAEYAAVWPSAAEEESYGAALAALLAPGAAVLTHRLRTWDCRPDMEEAHRLARLRRPKVIVAGWSAYPRRLDYAHYRRIADEVGALLLVDMANVAGAVAAGLHPNPVPHAHVVTTADHPTLGGTVLTGDPHVAQWLDALALPGGPCHDGTSARAVAYRFAATPEFRERQARALRAARILAGRLLADDVADAGVRVLTGSTETDHVLVSLTDPYRGGLRDVRGPQAALNAAGVPATCAALPTKSRTQQQSSVLSITTTALAGRGLDDPGHRAAAETVARVLTHEPGERVPAHRRIGA
ncbi:hypothetical protein ACIBKX_08900 [Streptomyces sp. NPDC050658]|uniref:hypothetical protein n=1 Tax=unclassified Streptomyces TaxID=2593676 RepID=UPI003447FE0D